MQHTSGFSTLVQDAKKQIKETNVIETKKMIDAKESFYLVDVREDREWQQGHLPNAIHLGKGVIERDIEKQIPNKESKIILYCGGGSRSALAAEAIQRMGYQQVLSMDGGFRGWLDNNFPIVSST